MNYWNEVKRNTYMIALFLISMLMSYNVGIYMQWTDPVEDMRVFIPVCMSGILTYIFIGPYVRYILEKPPV